MGKTLKKVEKHTHSTRTNILLVELLDFQGGIFSIVLGSPVG